MDQRLIYALSLIIPSEAGVGEAKGLQSLSTAFLCCERDLDSLWTMRKGPKNGLRNSEQC